MRALIGLLIATTLALGSGCAKQDWIDRTQVTVDVTGTWEGTPAASGYGAFQLSLEQHGSQVNGRVRHVGAAQACVSVAGPLEGSVAGDVFSFKQTNASVTGEMRVGGDEMSGGGAGSCGRFQITLRRVKN